MIRCLGCWMAVCLAIHALVPAPARSAATDPVAVSAPSPSVAGEIARHLMGDGPLWVSGRNLRHAAELRQVYAERGFASLWHRRTAPVPAQEALWTRLRAADAEGLDPLAYHPGAIAVRLGTTDPARLAELDLLLTDALMAYARDLARGRVDPGLLPAGVDLAPPPLDLAAVVREVLAAKEPGTVLDALAPPHGEYRRLRRALQQMRALQRAGDWPEIPAGPALKPGMRDPAVAKVRRLLRAAGDLPPDARVEGGPADVFDAELAAAVRRFQARHGLAVDGVVGRHTRSAMNVRPEERVQQIRVNMERWRWMPRDLGRRHVLVNVPGFTLRAVEEGKTVLTMPVIVGSTVRRTPMFSSRITYLVFNPIWNVPPSIARKDILPRVRKDPGYLANHRFQVYAGWQPEAALLDPAEIDWDAVGARIMRYRLRQMPGPDNALGRVKFMFPNAHDVYLHDTPEREKFRSAVRAFSSGCVRVGDPDGLAAFLLAGMEAWGPDRRAAVLETEEPTVVWLRRPVPVHLFYQTIWLDDAGVLQVRDDIYGRDHQLRDFLDPHGSGREEVAAIRP